ncbi:MAG: Hsp33 family molecular chaperone HslO [Firmicutes bacterium]|nr:Hsp33 family molecular chaperone HslO [Bacillota bacterium]
MSDYLIKAMAAGGQIRAYAATTAAIVEEARQRHNTSPIASAALGRLLTAGAMMGAMMKTAEEKLTLRINGSGPIGGLTVCADAASQVKGYAKNPQVMLPPTPNGKLDVAGAIGAGVLSVTRDLRMGEPFTGNCILVSGEIAEDLTYYFATSEQTPSSVALGVQMNKNNTVKHAGGFILQLMPDADDGIAEALENKIAALPPVTTLLDQSNTPEDILQLLLGDHSLQILSKTPCAFACDCSKERILAAIAGLQREELAAWIEDQIPVEGVCEFCGEKYQIQPEELRRLFDGKSDA